MRENLTVVFCLLAAFALVFGKSAVPPSLTTAYSAYQSALDRGDLKRAARYGEAVIIAARSSSLLDVAGRARLAAMVASAEAQAGNRDRARTLYKEALAGLNDGAHSSEIASATAQLRALEPARAEQALRGSLAAAAGSGS